MPHRGRRRGWVEQPKNPGVVPASRKSRTAVDKKSLMDEVLAGIGAPQEHPPAPPTLPVRKRRDDI